MRFHSMLLLLLLPAAVVAQQAIYPDAVITDTQATLQINTSAFGPRTLTATISPTATAISINDATGFLAPSVIWIENEAIKISAAGGTSMTVWTGPAVSVVSCTASSPVVVTTAGAHNLTGSERVTITGSSNCDVAANRIVRTGPDTFELTGVSSLSPSTGGSMVATGRGFDGTTPASHTAGKLIQALAVAAQVNQLLREVQALETVAASGVTFPLRAPNGGIISWKDGGGTDRTILTTLNGSVQFGHQVAPVSGGDTYLFAAGGAVTAGIHMQARSDNVMVFRPIDAATCPLCTTRGFLGDNLRPWEAFIGQGTNLLTIGSTPAQLLINDRDSSDGLDTYVGILGAPDGTAGTYFMSLPADPPPAGYVLTSLGLIGSVYETAWAPAAGGSAPPYTDSNDLIKGSANDTRRLRFEIDNLTPGITRSLTPQDSDYIIAGTNRANNYSVTQVYNAAISFSPNNFYNIGGPTNAPATVYARTSMNTPQMRLEYVSAGSVLDYFDFVAGPSINAFSIRDSSLNTIFNYFNPSGTKYWTIEGHVRPEAALSGLPTHDLGTSADRWRKVWADQLDLSGAANFSAAATFGGGVTIPVGTASIIDVGGGDLGVGTSGNFYGRRVAGATSGVSCSGVRDGWQGQFNDGGTIYLVLCDGGNRYRAQFTSY